ncbi:MAG: efflux RND transporter periplasmic adaptor subunit [Desulfobulbus sp.]
MACLAVLLGGGIWLWFRLTADDPITYLTEAVRRGVLTRQVVAIGKIEAVDLVQIGAQVSGQIKKVHVELGQQVKKGDLVAEIDSVSQRNRYNTDKAALNSLQAQLVAKQAAQRIAQTRYDREKALRKRDATSREAFESAENTLALAKAETVQVQAQIRQTELALDTDELNLSYTRITAPLDGVVVAVIVDEGQTVNANQTTPTIAQVADLRAMENSIEISEGDIGAVKVGMPVSFTILSLPDTPFQGRITSLDPGLTTLSDGKYGTGQSPSTGSTNLVSEAVYFYGKARVDNPDGLLRIGMTTENTITVAEARDVLMTPLTALSTGEDGKKTVRVLVEEGEVEERVVTTGLSDGVRVEIRSGLDEGEKVIIGQLTAAELKNVGRSGRPGGGGRR